MKGSVLSFLPESRFGRDVAEKVRETFDFKEFKGLVSWSAISSKSLLIWVDEGP